MSFGTPQLPCVRLAGLFAPLLTAILALLMPGKAWAQDFSADLRTLSPKAALDATIDALAIHYPLTEWKGTDWEALRQQFSAEFSKLSASDTDALASAWIRFTHTAFDDGHVAIMPIDEQALATFVRYRAQRMGGDFGIRVARCDDGATRVVQVDAAAAAQGMQWGAEIITWNGVGPNTAMMAEDLTVGPVLAREETATVERELLLTRGPVGSTAQIVFRNPGDAQEHTATLTAAAADMEGYLNDNFYNTVIERSDEFMPHWIREDGVAVIRLRQMMPEMEEGDTLETLLEKGEVMIAQFRAILEEFQAAAAPGLIIDLRGNEGGADLICAELCSLLYTHDAHFSDTWEYDTSARKWTINTDDPFKRVTISGGTPVYNGPIAVLVDWQTISAGEGFAHHLAALPQATVYGFFGSNGSFASTGGYCLLPGGFVLGFPVGRCTDINGRVLIDSDAQGKGGVLPDVCIPRSVENLRALTFYNIDVEMETAAQRLLGKDPKPIGWGWTDNDLFPWFWSTELGWVYLGHYQPGNRVVWQHRTGRWVRLDRWH